MAERECECMLRCCALVLLFARLCVFAGVLVHVNPFYVYQRGLRQRRKGVMNCAFIPLCRAPFTYPHGEYDGVELACQCKCLVVLHAVSVLFVSKGIKLGEQDLWHR